MTHIYDTPIFMSASFFVVVGRIYNILSDYTHFDQQVYIINFLLIFIKPSIVKSKLESYTLERKMVWSFLFDHLK